MKSIIIVIIVISISGLVKSQTINQELISSGGNSFNNSNYQLDWSIGESVTETCNTGDYLLTQGFHQNTLDVTIIENLASEINLTVYPNPANDFILISFNDEKFYLKQGVILTLIDSEGKILQKKRISNNIEQFSFSTYAKGIYFINISNENRIIKSYKIIKN